MLNRNIWIYCGRNTSGDCWKRSKFWVLVQAEFCAADCDGLVVSYGWEKNWKTNFGDFQFSLRHQLTSWDPKEKHTKNWGRIPSRSFLKKAISTKFHRISNNQSFAINWKIQQLSCPWMEPVRIFSSTWRPDAFCCFYSSPKRKGSGGCKSSKLVIRLISAQNRFLFRGQIQYIEDDIESWPNDQEFHVSSFSELSSGSCVGCRATQEKGSGASSEVQSALYQEPASFSIEALRWYKE